MVEIGTWERGWATWSRKFICGSTAATRECRSRDQDAESAAQPRKTSTHPQHLHVHEMSAWVVRKENPIMLSLPHSIAPLTRPQSYNKCLTLASGVAEHVD
jgi:hypothetical protein